MVAWGRGLEHDKRLLQEENARLKAEVERLTKQNALATPRSLIASQDIQSLKAEVERLTKAGDAMQTRLNFFQKRWDSDELCEEAEAWHKAKGVQS